MTISLPAEVVAGFLLAVQFYSSGILIISGCSAPAAICNNCARRVDGMLC